MTEDIEVYQEDLDNKIKQYFPGRIVRKDLTKQIKEGANVPVYVLEYLLGKYCSQDEALVDEGVARVKNILSDNYVRPDEVQKILSKLKEYGSYSIIDIVNVTLDYRADIYMAHFSNLGLKVPIDPIYPQKYERLLGGNLWCMINLQYTPGDAIPFVINQLTPIQLPHLDLDEIMSNRQHFSKEEWIDLILRSCGLEPTKFDYRVKWLLLARLVPLAENNFNLCELGPRSTGKSHVYKEISPNSILVSGGQTTVANLFFNMRTEQMGLVGLYDCVAFDEVAGIKFKKTDGNDGVAIMKDYMASGSFSRGKTEKTASASMVFVGNINQSVESILKTSNLFEPFPPEMGRDTAFFDRMHCYNPGWEIPKYSPSHFTNDYGFITDFLSEYLREMRKKNYSDAFEPYFKLGHDLNQRDTVAVKKMVSGLVKIVYPDGNFDKEDIREILELALESRRRVKEQLKKIGGMEFYSVNFSYMDLDEEQENYVTVAEQVGSKLIPEGMIKPGHLYSVGMSLSGKLGAYKLETELMPGNGKFSASGLGSKKEVKDSVDIAYKYFMSNSSSISGQINYKDKNYVIQYKDLYGVGLTKHFTLATFVALCSAALNKPILSSTAILGNFSLGGTIEKVPNLSDSLQLCLDAGAKKVLLPMSSSVDFGLVPSDLLSKFTIIFYNSPEEAVKKVLGFE